MENLIKKTLFPKEITLKLENDFGGGNSNIFYVHPYLRKISILTNVFFKWVVQPPSSYFGVQDGTWILFEKNNPGN